MENDFLRMEETTTDLITPVETLPLNTTRRQTSNFVELNEVNSQSFLQNVIRKFHASDCFDYFTDVFGGYTSLKRGFARTRKNNPMLMLHKVNKDIVEHKIMKDYQNMNNSDQELLTVATTNCSTTVALEEAAAAAAPPLPPPVENLYPNIIQKTEKVCCLCNLGERSSLGQGDLLQIESIGEIFKCAESDCSRIEESANKPAGLESCSAGKKHLQKNKPSILLDFCNELDKVGHSKLVTLDELNNEAGLHVHRMCAMWSHGFSNTATDAVLQIKLIATESLERKCTFCKQFGASVICKLSCNNIFHMPCAAAAGCFQLMETFTVLCANHIDEITAICAEKSVVCRHCFDIGDISKLVVCSTCGDHYHTNCVGIANLPDTKCGWNCYQCIKCQICRTSDTMEGRSIRCEHCQKLYHASCLRPVIASIPKLGWKCNRCRVCTDCGSRTPGSGTSSRWHCHYSVCDSCYQQRNKGFSCPICRKAYRAAAYKEMVKCSLCNRFVHGSCDIEADLSVYHNKKEINPDYDYICPNCITTQGNCNAKLSSLPSLASFLPGESAIRPYYCDGIKKSAITDTKMYNTFKFTKKRTNFKDNQRCRRDKLMLERPSLVAQLGRKRVARAKNLQSFNAGDIFDSNNHSDYDLMTEKKLLLCSIKDKFILSQDICVMCGSVGTEQDGCLIACSQCGQCFHPYCVSIKLSKVMVEKGWRCLDCIVCEGCGQKNDEARLILCDECDISYHIYCMVPPLDTVPHGSWKCKWCAVCHKCGRKTVGLQHVGQNSLKECAVCVSQVACYVCTQEYKENEAIIQCNSCDRWLHYQCDNASIMSTDSKQLNKDYHCLQCRASSQNGTSLAGARNDADSKYFNQNVSPRNLATNDFKSKASQELNFHSVSELNLNGNKCLVDGTYVTEMGADMIKSLSLEVKRKRKVRNEPTKRDFGVLDAIESVVSGSIITSTEGEDAEEIKKQKQNFSEEILWRGTETRPPDGFSIYTNDEGMSILRKKRQRNLQKLGIGGFNIRSRTFRKIDDENSNITFTNAPIQVELKKKKKILTKKFKNKLIDTYPAYLQEAFFGKSLLDCNQSQPPFSISDSSNERCNMLMNASYSSSKGN